MWKNWEFYLWTSMLPLMNNKWAEFRKHFCKRDLISNDKGPKRGKTNKTCCLSTAWTVLLGTNNLPKYFFIKLAIKNWGYSFFLKMSFNNTFQMKNKCNMNYEVKCKLRQVCMQQA